MAAIHAFGPFRLDAEAEILFKGAEPVPLGRRAVALLRALVVRRIGLKAHQLEPELAGLDFTAVHQGDLLLAPIFAHMGPDHPSHVAAFLAEVLGGPATYSERHGGHPHMIQRHLTGRGVG